MLLLIDNYDSFTHILGLNLRELGADVSIYRNDQIDIADIQRMSPAHIVISPGPGSPDDAGISRAAVQTFAGEIPILGVCLGHQVIADVYGGKVARAGKAIHGKISRIEHDGAGVFAGLPAVIEATRYHSLSVDPASLPACLTATAWSRATAGERPEIMGLRHRWLPIEGIQFHPESVCTPAGLDMLRNFLGENAPMKAA